MSKKFAMKLVGYQVSKKDVNGITYINYYCFLSYPINVEKGNGVAFKQYVVPNATIDSTIAKYKDKVKSIDDLMNKNLKLYMNELYKGQTFQTVGSIELE